MCFDSAENDYTSMEDLAGLGPDDTSLKGIGLKGAGIANVREFLKKKHLGLRNHLVSKTNRASQ